MAVEVTQLRNIGMVGQGANHSPGCDIPQLDSVVYAARSNAPAVRAERDRRDIIRMSLKAADQSSGDRVPYLNGFVGASGGQQRAVRAEGDGADVIRMSVLDNQIRFFTLGGLQALGISGREGRNRNQ